MAAASIAAKQVFTAELQDELSKCDGLSPEQKTELETLITNKIQGDVALKEDRVIFFSHSSWDKHFGDFFHFDTLLSIILILGSGYGIMIVPAPIGVVGVKLFALCFGRRSGKGLFLCN